MQAQTRGQRTHYSSSWCHNHYEAACKTDVRLANGCQLLQQSAERARHANAINGMLIRIRMDYNERTLSVLRAAPQRNGFYGPDGRVAAAAR